jgi:energy-coupling factor transporter ATP-binding protein EcfA2
MASDTSPKLHISELTVSDGTKVEIPKSGVTLFVGPNNAGKSQSLKDIQGIAKNDAQHYRPRTIVEQELVKAGDVNFRSWLELNLPSVTVDGIPRYHVRNWTQATADDIQAQWNQPRLNVLTDLFILLANGIERLSVGHSEPAIDFTREAANGPIQRAYSDPDLAKEIGRRCKQAFGLDIVVDRYAGSVIPLRIGEPPEFEHDSGSPTKSYLEKLRRLPKLEDQGDGIRSYMGLILNILAGNHDIILIDEPEAFLHPPQARLLAQVLAERADEHQVFLATHSTSIVQGALESSGSTTIVRLTRNGEINHAAVLKEQDVKDLWSDPLLRYSNVLDGLFHDAVVLCESDSDCRYYQAVLDATEGKDKPKGNDELPKRDLQLLFTHCGGKARLSSVVDALRAVKVPVVVVADFDFLRDAEHVKRLVTSIGGNFEGSLQQDLSVLQAALKSDAKPLRRTPLKEAFIAALDSAPQEVLSARDVEHLRAIIRAETGWDKAKRSGTAAVPQGDAFAASERVLAALAVLGILVVPVGELEGFARTVSGHGPAWVSEVLEQGLHQSPSNEALDFVRKIKDTSTALSASA